MKIIAFIEQEEIIEKILKHLGLWLVKKGGHPGYIPHQQNSMLITPILKSRPGMMIIAWLPARLARARPGS